MKRTASIFAALALVVVFTAGAMASDQTGTLTPVQYARAEQTLLNGLQEDNLGVKEGSAYMLGELKSAKAVIPLMKMLRDGDQESTRIVAALALCRIGDPRGLYAVKRATQFDDSERVAQRCAWFYNSYVKAGAFEFAAVGSPDATEMAKR
ncbi:MAG: HEAT repeat domain-containing protein [Bacteroidetes bacterium]|nr:HEAT repeat domain-containing protein [Bacteroidota bacterium]